MVDKEYRATLIKKIRDYSDSSKGDLRTILTWSADFIEAQTQRDLDEDTGWLCGDEHPLTWEGIKKKNGLFSCDSIRVDNNPDNVSPDPWKHRSKGMKCATCMWFVEKKPAFQKFLTDDDLLDREEMMKRGMNVNRTIGRCRRHAPTMNGYPVVYSDDWCGDHKLDETKA